MIQSVRALGARLAVGLLRRFAPTLRWTKDALDRRCSARSARSTFARPVFRWPVKSAAMFSPSCGGVLADIGAHIIDLMLWWFGDGAASSTGTTRRAASKPSPAGGRDGRGVTGRVELSRTRDPQQLRHPRRCGTLEVGTKTDSTVT